MDPWRWKSLLAPLQSLDSAPSSCTLWTYPMSAFLHSALWHQCFKLGEDHVPQRLPNWTNVPLVSHGQQQHTIKRRAGITLALPPQIKTCFKNCNPSSSIRRVGLLKFQLAIPNIVPINLTTLSHPNKSNHWKKKSSIEPEIKYNGLFNSLPFDKCYTPTFNALVVAHYAPDTGCLAWCYSCYKMLWCGSYQKETQRGWLGAIKFIQLPTKPTTQNPTNTIGTLLFFYPLTPGQMRSTLPPSVHHKIIFKMFGLVGQSFRCQYNLVFNI